MPQNALKAYARIPVLFETPRSKDSLNQPDVADKPVFTLATVNKILSQINIDKGNHHKDQKQYA